MTTTYIYQERATVFGGEWIEKASFSDKGEALAYFDITPKDGLDARLIKRVTTETIVDSEYNDKDRR